MVPEKAVKRLWCGTSYVFYVQNATDAFVFIAIVVFFLVHLSTFYKVNHQQKMFDQSQGCIGTAVAAFCLTLALAHHLSS